MGFDILDHRWKALIIYIEKKVLTNNEPYLKEKLDNFFVDDSNYNKIPQINHTSMIEWYDGFRKELSIPVSKPTKFRFICLYSPDEMNI